MGDSDADTTGELEAIRALLLAILKHHAIETTD